MRHRAAAPPDWDGAQLAAETASAMPHEVPVVCSAPPTPESGCVCGTTAAPMVNVGLVWASGVPAVARLFNWTAQTIVDRLRGEPVRDPSGAVLDFRAWEQDVMNEALFLHARVPRGLSGVGGGRVGGGGEAAAAATCHPMDADCRAPVLPTRPNSHGVRSAPRWWVSPPRHRSVWLASTPRRHDGGCGDDTDLIAVTELADGTRVGVVPQTAAGRLCAQRKVPFDELRRLPQLPPAEPCSAFRPPAKLLGQEVLHAQFTNYYTRQHIWSALRWWPSSATAGGAYDAHGARGAAVPRAINHSASPRPTHAATSSHGSHPLQRTCRPQRRHGQRRRRRTMVPTRAAAAAAAAGRRAPCHRPMLHSA